MALLFSSIPWQCHRAGMHNTMTEKLEHLNGIQPSLQLLLWIVKILLDLDDCLLLNVFWVMYVIPKQIPVQNIFSVPVPSAHSEGNWTSLMCLAHETWRCSLWEDVPGPLQQLHHCLWSISPLMCYNPTRVWGLFSCVLLIQGRLVVHYAAKWFSSPSRGAPNRPPFIPTRWQTGPSYLCAAGPFHYLHLKW